ncbi:MAG: hypothetical protein ABI743_04980 [bacterium]
MLRRDVLALMAGVFLTLILGVGCDKLNSLTTSIAGNIYRDGVPTGGHLILSDFNTGTTAATGETTDGHFIIGGVKSGEYVLRYMDMRGLPMGGGMYINVQPGRPVTELKFEVWEIIPPDKKDKEGNLVMTKEDFMKKFSLKEKPAEQ